LTSTAPVGSGSARDAGTLTGTDAAADGDADGNGDADGDGDGDADGDGDSDADGDGDGCAARTADCNGLMADGCETPLDTSTDCGGCGVPCALAHATATCASGTCEIVECDPDWGDCDGWAENGCDSPLDTSTDCGGCGVPCALAHATARCASGTCELAGCDPSWGDCDGTAQNGCEADLLSDRRNCSECGHDCGGDSCDSGQCD
jgi:hypothetical protein